MTSWFIPATKWGLKMTKPKKEKQTNKNSELTCQEDSPTSKENENSKQVIKTGPKAIEFTEDDLSKIEKLAGYGLDMEKIAMLWGKCERTFYRYLKNNDTFKQAIQRGRAMANSKVAQTAYEMATSGESEGMTKFWLKTQAGWKEVSKMEFENVTKLEDIVAGAKDE